MQLRAFTLSILITAGLAPSEAAAYEPTDQKARNAVGQALNNCKQSLRKENPGLASDDDYRIYVRARDEALALDPKIMEWDAKYLGFVPSEMFPQCEKLFADYVAGVNADATPVSSACEKNTTSRLKSITLKYYPHYKANGFDGVAASAWMSRKDLESARYYMYGKGFETGGKLCAANDQHKKGFAPLKAKFKEAEKLVQEMEKARGVRFDRVEKPNHVVYIDLKTNKPVAKPDAL